MEPFKEDFVSTPHGKLFGAFYSKHAYFENHAFYYDSVFMDYLESGDERAKELWTKAYNLRINTGMPMVYLGEK